MSDEHDEYDDDLVPVDSALDRALAECPRDEFGNADEDVLVKLIAEKIDIDVDAARLRKAKQIVNAHTKPGSTKPEGELTLFDTYGYEPRRLVRDDHGNIVEQDIALIAMKQAEARRSRRHVDDAQLWANRKTREAEEYAAWVIDQTKAGRTENDLTFGAFVRESGALS